MVIFIITKSEQNIYAQLDRIRVSATFKNKLRLKRFFILCSRRNSKRKCVTY